MVYVIIIFIGSLLYLYISADGELSGFWLLWACGGTLLGFTEFIKGFRVLRKKRLIENLPTSKIRSIAMGLVEIVGKVVPVDGKILKSPFSNTDCVFYSYEIDKKSDDSWSEVEYGSNGQIFSLQDDTASVLIDPAGGEIQIALANEINSSFSNDPPELVKQFLQSRRISYKGLLGNSRLKFSEYLIVPGASLYILGTAGDNPFVENKTAVVGVEDIMISKGEGNNPYYISENTEAKLVLDLDRETKSSIFGGATLSILGLIAIIIYFRLL